MKYKEGCSAPCFHLITHGSNCRDESDQKLSSFTRCFQFISLSAEIGKARKSLVQVNVLNTVPDYGGNLAFFVDVEARQ